MYVRPIILKEKMFHKINDVLQFVENVDHVNDTTSFPSIKKLY